MRLLVHNFLQCHSKACPIGQNYPLDLTVSEWALDQPVPDYSRETVLRLLPKVEWSALLKTCQSLNIDVGFPSEKPGEDSGDEVLESVLRVLLGRHVVTGEMRCNGCSRVYPITNSIPNMLLQEDEI